MANKNWGAIALIGGGHGALDRINGDNLNDMDFALTNVDGEIYLHNLDAASGAAEDSPEVISPDTNAGTKRWILANLNLKNLIVYGKLGIGTTSPQQVLHVVGDRIHFDGVHIEYSTDDSHAQYLSAATANGHFYIRNRRAGKLFLQTNDITAITIANNQNVGIGTVTPSAKIDIDSDLLRLRTAKTPASAGDTGNAGDICWDSDYIYICVATNTWKRTAISTW